MGCHIVFTLGRVDVGTVTIRSKTREDRLEVDTNVRISILTEDQRGARMLNEDMT